MWLAVISLLVFGLPQVCGHPALMGIATLANPMPRLFARALHGHPEVSSALPLRYCN
jgi:hypothetical protein